MAGVPVSIRTGDPAVRVRQVSESMRADRDMHDALPASELTQVADFPPPAVFSTVIDGQALNRATADASA